ncbi:hypothetical protein [Petrachloros mirabilis]
MRSFSKEHLTKRLRDLRAGIQHAFARQSDAQPPSVEDLQLMERIADAIVKRGMAAPTTLFLESMGPMNFLGSQALHFLSPIIDCAFSVKEVEQVACLLERRDTISRLIVLIEARSTAKRTSPQ